MKKLVLAAALTAAASTVSAGSLEEPVVEEPVVESEDSFIQIGEPTSPGSSHLV